MFSAPQLRFSTCHARLFISQSRLCALDSRLFLPHTGLFVAHWRLFSPTPGHLRRIQGFGKRTQGYLRQITSTVSRITFTKSSKSAFLAFSTGKLCFRILGIYAVSRILNKTFRDSLNFSKFCSRRRMRACPTTPFPVVQPLPKFSSGLKRLTGIGGAIARPVPGR
jgi:hypothetical protein